MMHDTPTEEMFGTMGYFLGIILFLLLFVSLYFALEKDYKNHKRVIRLMFVLQTVFILWMIFSLVFTYYGKNYTTHAFVGAAAYLLIAYTFMLMEGRIPEEFRIPRKYNTLLMEIAFVVWGGVILWGTYLYLTVCC